MRYLHIAGRYRFQSTPSVGRATAFTRSDSHLHRISIHALRGEGDVFSPLLVATVFLFQSTPSVGRATNSQADNCKNCAISIHALRGEGDECSPPCRGTNAGFQSTPSVGRATRSQGISIPLPENFNPRPPWGGRLDALTSAWTALSFQSTPSVGRATFEIIQVLIKAYISIHALRGEGDEQADPFFY